MRFHCLGTFDISAGKHRSTCRTNIEAIHRRRGGPPTRLIQSGLLHHRLGSTIGYIEPIYMYITSIEPHHTVAVSPAPRDARPAGPLFRQAAREASPTLRRRVVTRPAPARLPASGGKPNHRTTGSDYARIGQFGFPYSEKVSAESPSELSAQIDRNDLTTTNRQALAGGCSFRHATHCTAILPTFATPVIRLVDKWKTA